MQRSGPMLKEIRERARAGKETMREVPYGRVGRRSARTIQILGEPARLSGSEIRAVVEKDLSRLPQHNS